MAVTTRLLHRLNEALGDDATEDLLACFQEASALNREALREIAELYFARSEARIDASIAGLRGGTDSAIAELRGGMDSSLAELRGGTDSALAELRGAIAGLRGETRLALAEMRGDMNSALANQRAELLKWMFLFWAGTVIPLAGLFVGLIRR